MTRFRLPPNGTPATPSAVGGTEAVGHEFHGVPRLLRRRGNRSYGSSSDAIHATH